MVRMKDEVELSALLLLLHPSSLILPLGPAVASLTTGPTIFGS